MIPIRGLRAPVSAAPPKALAPVKDAKKTNAVVRAGEIFAVLKIAAQQGERCPTNSELADRFHLVSTSSISSALHFLEANGMIRIARGNANRVVTICATGQHTAGQVTKPHWRERAA